MNHRPQLLDHNGLKESKICPAFQRFEQTYELSNLCKMQIYILKMTLVKWHVIIPRTDDRLGYKALAVWQLSAPKNTTYWLCLKFLILKLGGHNSQCGWEYSNPSTPGLIQSLWTIWVYLLGVSSLTLSTGSQVWVKVTDSNAACIAVQALCRLLVLVPFPGTALDGW